MTLPFHTDSPGPAVVLAPMAGITDLPFRDCVAGFGADLVVSEMVASGELITNRPGTREKAELGLERAATSVQLAGRDPILMAEAARIVADQGAKIIDINMGCPAKKVTGGLSGSALMRDPDLALRLIDAVAGATSVPVTVKMRLGWDDTSQNAPELARRANAAGVQMITVHGRTRCQFYKGKADWSAIANVVRAVDIPVLANGDIVDLDSATSALTASGAAGVMIGRGAQGQPWVVAQIRAVLNNQTPVETPQGDALADHALAHYRAILAFYGAELGLRVARKHLGWYMDRARTNPGMRGLVLRASTPDWVIDHLAAALLDPADDPTARNAVTHPPDQTRPTPRNGAGPAPRDPNPARAVA